MSKNRNNRESESHLVSVKFHDHRTRYGVYETSSHDWLQAESTFVFHTKLFMHIDIIGAEKKSRAICGYEILGKKNRGTKAKTDKRLEVR